MVPAVRAVVEALEVGRAQGAVELNHRVTFSNAAR